MTDDFSKAMALLDEIEHKAPVGVKRSALTAQERSLLIGRLMAISADTVGGAAAPTAREPREREHEIASRWFG